jgi:hypothetical protein
MVKKASNAHSGSTSTGTVAQAASLQSSSTVTAFTVSDTAANIGADFGTLNGDSKLTGITVTDGLPIPLSYTQYTTGTTARALLPAGTTFILSAVPKADAASIQASAAITSFSVTDTTANVLAGLATLAAATKLSSITLSGATTLAVTYSQYATYTKTLNLLASPSALTVSAVGATNAATVQAGAKVSGFSVSDTSANIAAGLATLSTDTKLTAITLTGGSTLSISYTQYASYEATLGLLATADSLTVSGAAGSNAATLQSATKVAAFAVTDTAANVAASLTALAADTKLSSISLTGGTTLAVTDAQYLADTSTLNKLASGDTMAVSAATVAGAAALQASAHVGSFAIADTAADVINGLTSLGGDTKLSSITLTGGTSITVTYAEYKADTAALDKLAAGDTMVVTGVTAAAAATVAADTHVQTLTVSDTLADVGTSISSLETLATSGQVAGIAVTDSGQNLSLTSAQYTADQAAIGLMTGSFTVTQPVINLIWDASVADAPAGFVAAVEDAADYFDALITSPITVNIEVGYGEYDGTTMPSGALGETQLLNSDYISTAQFATALSSDPSTPAVQSALASIASTAEPASVFVEGGDAKAVGATAAYGTEVDAAIGFALDPTGRMFSYDPTNRAILGQVDFIGVAEAEIGHALGRNSYLGISGALDLYRYSSPGTLGVAGSSPTYFSIDGGTTNLDNFATSLDYGDWAASAGNDAVDAVIPTGSENLFGATDVTELNVLGYGIAANAPSSAAVIAASAAGGLNAASLTFIGSPVTVTMGGTTTTATAAIPPAAGIEEIAGFTYGSDKLTLNLSDLSGSLEAFDTTVGGVHAIALAGSNDLTNGIVLLGMPAADTAANLLASHMTLSGSTATIT